MLVFIMSFASLLAFGAPESCYYQRCLNCNPQELVSPGAPVQCDPGNWVSAQWIHNYGHPPPWTSSKVPIEYRCLKLVATPDDKSLGNTVDIIRGCIPRAQVDSVCSSLTAVERARAHSDAKCFICRGNDCNAAVRRDKVPLYTFLATVTLYFVLK